MKRIIPVSVLALLLFMVGNLTAQEVAGAKIATLRGDAALAEQEPTKRIPKVINKDIRKNRIYPMQLPGGPQAQQVHVVPQPPAHRREPGADGQRDPLYGSRW